MFRFVYQQSWISKVFLAFIAFSFIIGTAIMWGPGGLNFGFGNYVVKVGDITVSPKEFLLELTRLQNLYGEKLNKEQLKKAALNNLIITSLFAYLAERDGFFVSNKEIADFIRRQFSVNGTFEVKNFERYLQMLKLTPSEYEDMVRKTLLANKYKSAVYSTTYADDETLKVLLLPYTVKVKVELIKVPLKVFEKNVKFTEKELKEFYKQVEGNFYEKVPPRVEVFFAKTEKEAEEIYKLLKEGKTEGLKPLKVIPADQKPPKELEDIFYKTLKGKNIAIQKTEKGFYIGLYLPEEKKKLPFEEVKNQVQKIFVEYKTLEWLKKNKDKLVEEVLKGKLKGEKEIKELIGAALIANFGLTLPDLIDLIKTKKPFGVVLPDGLYVIKVLKVEKVNELGEDVETTYKLYLRKTQYLRRLQEVLDYIMRTNGVSIQVNQNLLQRI